MDGVKFKILVEKTVGEAKSFVVVGGQRGGKLNRSAETVDTTTKDAGGWKEARPGLLEWSIDGDGIYLTGNEGYNLIETAFIQKELVKVRMAVEGGVGFEGMAVIVDFPLDMPFDNEVTYSIKVQGTGALVPVVASKEAEVKEVMEVKKK